MTTSRPARTGRRPGNPDTRQVVLDAARATFAQSGFDGASIRRIATTAGVDPALVHHYFGTKEELFLASIEIPVDVPSLLGRIAAQGPDGIGPRLVAMMLSVWESPVGAGLAGWLRTALSDPGRAAMIRELVVNRLAGPFAASLGIPPDEREIRAGLVMTQVIGVIVGRYLLLLDPVVSMSRAELVTSVGATVQRYLTCPLPPATDPPPLPGDAAGLTFESGSMTPPDPQH